VKRSQQGCEYGSGILLKCIKQIILTIRKFNIVSLKTPYSNKANRIMNKNRDLCLLAQGWIYE